MADKTGSLLQCLYSPVGSGETKVFDLLQESSKKAYSFRCGDELDATKVAVKYFIDF